MNSTNRFDYDMVDAGREMPDDEFYLDRVKRPIFRSPRVEFKLVELGRVDKMKHKQPNKSAFDCKE